ncbi:MAG TPA: hypothetical protein VMT38_00370 [Terracidiphilus sp.]|nr:hypothetical protein [Terracidiphilus sp.]
MSIAEPVTPFIVAVIVALPAPTPVARPVALTVAMDWFEEDQITEAVTLPVVPLL